MIENRNLASYEDILARWIHESRLRVLPPDRHHSDAIDLAGNDYLGLAQRNREFLKVFVQNSELLFTSAASRLLSCRQDSFTRLENLLGQLYGRDVLLFNSGYHANTGCLSALAVPGTVFLADKLIHASMIDGLTLGRAEYYRWKHNDLTALRRLLEKHHGPAERIVVAVESVYSMDGDMAPLRELVDLKREFPKIILYVDEAHAFGVRGNRGLGLCEESGLMPEINIIIGTFGKACASQGAFAATSGPMRDYLLNSARSFIFSTAMPPVCCDWTALMIETFVDMQEERKHLNNISREFNEFLGNLTGVQSPSQSQIAPMVIGDAARAVKIANALQQKGIIALPIRRPTVPPGTERIRFSLNASLTNEQLQYIKSSITEVYRNEN